MRTDVAYIRTKLGSADARAFDEFTMRARGSHYMQVATWPAAHAQRVLERFMIVRQGERVIGTARMLRGHRGPIPSPNAVIERGPVVERVEDLNVVLPAMLRTVRRHGVMQLRIQPYWSGGDASQAQAIASRHGFTVCELLDGPHTSTVRLDWSPGANSDEMFAGSSRSDLRRHARKAAQLGVTVRRGDRSDLRKLGEMYVAMMAQQDIFDRPVSYFEAFGNLLDAEVGAVFCAEHNGVTEAIVLVFHHATQVTFHMGATTSERRPFKKMLLPLMAAAQWGASLGATTFDLGGVPRDDDNDPKRRAIAQFKFDFGKDIVPIAPPMFAPKLPGEQVLRSALSTVKSLLRRGA